MGSYRCIISWLLITLLGVSNISMAQCGYLIEIIQVSNVSCNDSSDGALEIFVSGATPPYFYNGFEVENYFTIDSLFAGTINISLSDSDNCDTILSFTITEPPPLETNCNITSFCDTSLITVIPNGGTAPYEFKLNNNTPILTDTAYYVVSSGDYIVEINDVMGCKKIDTINIISHDQIEIVLDSVKNETCLTSSDGAIYAHINGGIPPYLANLPLHENNQINAKDLSRGTYLLEVTDSFNCGNSRQVTLDYIDSVYVNILQEKEILKYGENIVFDIDYNISSDNVHFQWTPSGSLSCDDCPNPIAKPLTNTDYVLTIVDDNGCYSSDSVSIKLFSNVLFMPTAFTPNEDGLNDNFKSIGYLEGIINYTLMIFNRYGQLISEINEPNSGWDGYYNGEKCPSGTYVWKVIYEFDENPLKKGPITERGIVTLIR